MKKLQLLLFLVIFLAGCAQISNVLKDTGIKTPKVESVKPHITDIDFDGIEITFDIYINNPYPVPIKSPHFKYAVDIEKKEFVKSDNPVEMSLPASGTGTLQVPVKMGYMNMYNLYKNLKDKNEASYTLHGNIIIAVMGYDFNIPVTKSGTIPILKIPAFSDIKYDIGQVSKSGAKISATAQIKNPNIFDLDIKNIRYSLYFGDIKIGCISANAKEIIIAGKKTPITLSGEIGTRDAFVQILSGSKFDKPVMKLTGIIGTPYGNVKLYK